MAKDGVVLLDAPCLGDQEPPQVPARWEALSLGLSADAPLVVVSDQGVRAARIDAVSCAPASICLQSKILLALSDLPAAGRTGGTGRDLVAARTGVLSRRATVTRLSDEPRFRCGPAPDATRKDPYTACVRWRPAESPRLELQLWVSGHDGTESEYPYYAVSVRTVGDDDIIGRWREVFVGGEPPKVWAITEGGRRPRLLLMASSGGVGPRIRLQMLRVDEGGGIIVGRRYGAGGDACD